MDRRQFLKLLPAGALALPIGLHFQTDAGHEAEAVEAFGRMNMSARRAAASLRDLGRAIRYVRLNVDGEDFFIPLYSAEQIDG